MSRGKHKVLNGIDYRAGDGWRHAEPGDVVDDLDDVSEQQFRSYVQLGDIEPVKPKRSARSSAKRVAGKSSRKDKP